MTITSFVSTKPNCQFSKTVHFSDQKTHDQKKQSGNIGVFLSLYHFCMLLKTFVFVSTVHYRY